MVCATAQPANSGGGERSESQPQAVSRSLSVRGTQSARQAGSTEPLDVMHGDPALARVHYWMNSIPPDVKARSMRASGMSNIRQSDYVGPESCK